MLVKYSLGFQAPSVLRLAGWVLLISQFFCATTTCPPPDFPDRGGYEPVKAEYEVGQTVAYHCYGGLPVFDENHIWIQELQPVTCQSNGKWSGGTIFCEVPIKLKNPITSSKALESAVLDNSDTCSPTGNDTEEFLRFTLDHEAVVFSAMVCWGEGKKRLKISGSGWETTYHTNSPLCGIDHYQKNDVKTGDITVQISSDTASSIQLCKIQVFAKDDKWCLHPPEKSVPNGQLEVSRHRAVLRCNVGFKEKDGREVYATCENNKWSYLSLQCVGISCDPAVGNVSPSEGEWDSDGNTSEYYVGTKRMLKCKPGYHNEGTPLTVTCQENGTWTRTTAICKRTLCDPVFGNIISSEGEWDSDGKTSEFSVGTERTLKCKPGYHNEGDPLTVTCQENGTWTRTSATCIKTLCDLVDGNVSLTEGEWESDGNTTEYSVGTKRTLKCKPGYHSNGTPLEVTCLESGTWTRTSATCIKNKPQKDHKISLKKHLIIKKIPWRSRENCRIELKVRAKQHRYNLVEDILKKDHKILGNFILIKRENMTWHFQKTDSIQTKVNATQHRHNGAEDKPQKDYKILVDKSQKDHKILEDKSQKDYKILVIVVGSVFAIIILILVGVKIFFIARKKPIGLSVIFKHDGNNSHSTPPSIGGHSTTSLSEAENSTVYFMKQSKTT